MTVIPVKFIPYMLTIAGAYGLLSGEQDPFTSILFLAVGIVWLALKHSGGSAPAKAEKPAGQEAAGFAANGPKKEAAPQTESLFSANER